MSDFGDRKILRSFYLPEALDERLRVVAFRLHQSKGEVVRQLIGEALEARANGEPDTYVVGRAAAQVKPRPLPAGDQRRFAGSSNEIVKAVDVPAPFGREQLHSAYGFSRSRVEAKEGAEKATLAAEASELGVDHAESYGAVNLAPMDARVTFSYGKKLGETAAKGTEMPSAARED